MAKKAAKKRAKATKVEAPKDIVRIGHISKNSVRITQLGGVTGIAAGMSVRARGVPGHAKVVRVDSEKSVVMSHGGTENIMTEIIFA